MSIHVFRVLRPAIRYGTITVLGNLESREAKGIAQKRLHVEGDAAVSWTHVETHGLFTVNPWPPHCGRLPARSSEPDSLAARLGEQVRRQGARAFDADASPLDLFIEQYVLPAMTTEERQAFFGL